MSALCTRLQVVAMRCKVPAAAVAAAAAAAAAAGSAAAMAAAAATATATAAVAAAAVAAAAAAMAVAMAAAMAAVAVLHRYYVKPLLRRSDQLKEVMELDNQQPTARLSSTKQKKRTSLIG